MTSLTDSDKFCIIGAGAVGIGTGKCFKQAGIPFDIIERESDFGGLWNIAHAASKVYQSAHLISSKKNTQFSDYPMPADYPDYPNHRLFLAYLRNLAAHFNLYEHACFNMQVEKIEADGNYWQVSFHNGITKRYRGVIIANGRLHKPILPHYPGEFKGLVLHASAYKSPDIFKDKQVLIVGAGNSGCDIAVDAVHHAAHTIQSTRRGYHYMPKYIDGKPTQDWLMEIGTRFNSSQELWTYVKDIFKLAGFSGEAFGLPAPDHEIDQAHPIMNSQVLYHIGHGDIQIKPDIQSFKTNSVVFMDNTEEPVDVIIYATGYQADFPFLSADYLNPKNGLHDLFMYSFHRRFDNLLFAGFINAPSGLGNLANTLGRLFVAYIKALQQQSPSFQIFTRLKQGANPDLGQERYIKTDRHGLEVDLWKYIKAANLLTAKLTS